MKNALVVEDSLTDRDVITRSLQQGGFSVTCVSSVEEARVRLGQQRPDLIVLDVVLPGQSGFELCRQLKSNAETKAIPIVICSTKETDVDKMWGTMLGANAYLSKPVDSQELLGTAAKLVS